MNIGFYDNVLDYFSHYTKVARMKKKKKKHKFNGFLEKKSYGVREFTECGHLIIFLRDRERYSVYSKWLQLGIHRRTCLA